jgi:hypothetical protein
MQHWSVVAKQIPPQQHTVQVSGIVACSLLADQQRATQHAVDVAAALQQLLALLPAAGDGVCRWHCRCQPQLQSHSTNHLCRVV